MNSSVALLSIIAFSGCSTGSTLAEMTGPPDAISVTEELTEEQVMRMGRVDSDLDGFSNNDDVCPAISNPDQIDSDGDSVGDLCDECPNVSAPGYINGCSN